MPTVLLEEELAGQSVPPGQSEMPLVDPERVCIMPLIVRHPGRTLDEHMEGLSIPCFEHQRGPVVVDARTRGIVPGEASVLFPELDEARVDTAPAPCPGGVGGRSGGILSIRFNGRKAQQDG